MLTTVVWIVFPVADFHGTKSIVLTTRTVMGGNNPVIGFAYAIVSGICILLGLVFLLAHFFKPRFVFSRGTIYPPFSFPSLVLFFPFVPRHSSARYADFSPAFSFFLNVQETWRPYLSDLGGGDQKMKKKSPSLINLQLTRITTYILLNARIKLARA